MILPKRILLFSRNPEEQGFKVNPVSDSKYLGGKGDFFERRNEAYLVFLIPAAAAIHRITSDERKARHSDSHSQRTVAGWCRKQKQEND